MDILEHLMNEHREAEQLMDQLGSSEPGDERAQLVETLDEALRKHMAVEEQYVYPIVQQTLGEETESEADKEHELAREGLAKLGQLTSVPGFGAALDMVKAGIAHHVAEEEQEIFPKLRERAADQLAPLDPEALEQQIESGGADTSNLTKEDLYRQAKAADIPGRSAMTKDELAEAVSQSN